MLGSRVAQAALIVSTILCLFPAQTGAAICPPFTIHGNIGSGSPDSPSILAVREDRVFRNAVSSSCTAPKGCAPYGTSDLFPVDVYWDRFRNLGDSPLCISVSQVADESIFPVIYLGELGDFLWTDVCANFLADPGSSGVMSFSFVVPPRSEYVLVMEKVYPGHSDAYTVTIDDPPAVRIIQPLYDQPGLPPVNIPINVFLNSWDLNGVVHETVSLRGKGTGTCLLWDGYSYGDRDGLLSDDLSSAMGLQINKSLLCQAMARCGMHTLFSPEVVAEAWDCAGNHGSAGRVIRGRLSKSEVCSWP